MKEPEYIEGDEATRNFEEGMTALFKIPKDAVVKAERKAKRKRVARVESQRKPKISDKD